jgi:hypothetical protein
MSATHLQTAEYFADRARRSRHQEERDHFLELAQSHREIAAGTRLETELPKPPAPSVKRPAMRKRA